MANRSEFPSRQYSYPTRAGLVAQSAPLTAGNIYRFLLGADPVPVQIDIAEVEAQWHDPFAQLVLTSTRPLPMTLRALLAILDTANVDAAGLSVQASFVVADGGQIPWSSDTAALRRQIRFAITRAKQPGTLADLLISTSSAFDSPTTFLQVIGWDAVLQAYRFYDRRDGAWVYAGSSWEALVTPTRGKGPFDSHVNGALNMKELKLPWPNWHSEAAAIRDDILAADDPLRTEALWTQRTGAQEFERTFIRPGIGRWIDARFSACLADGRLGRLPEFMRHALETTTVNLTASPTENDRLAEAAQLPLPLTFFLNTDALLNAPLNLEPDIDVPQVAAALYRACLTKFDVAISDGSFRFPGDTHFVFVVPEPAYEDIAVLRTLISHSVISRKLAAALLMVDFPNPVFSLRRPQLMKYVPQSAAANGAGDLPEFVSSVEQAVRSLPGDSAEAEFLANWRLADTEWPSIFAKRIEDYMAKVGRQLNSPMAVEDLFRLAESRRREFRKRPLAEFRLTTPMTNIPETAPLLQLTQDAVVTTKAS